MNRSLVARFNIIQPHSGLKADCYLHTGNPLHVWAMANRKRITLKDNLKIWIVPPEYVIVRKLLYFQEGHSQKHIQDIQGMLLCSSDQINKQVLKSLLTEHHLISFGTDLNLHHCLFDSFFERKFRL
ncbi:MAG: hypothetical protein JW774_09910 [Candidatus Aureabacteria bacterium]|nr:hypothetical protein [Candidatus Auribacterota bacterium]